MLHRSLGRPIRDPQDTRFYPPFPSEAKWDKDAGAAQGQKEICSFAIVDLRSVSDEHKFSLGVGREREMVNVKRPTFSGSFFGCLVFVLPSFFYFVRRGFLFLLDLWKAREGTE